jgi:hypothetical protein
MVLPKDRNAFNEPSQCFPQDIVMVFLPIYFSSLTPLTPLTTLTTTFIASKCNYSYFCLLKLKIEHPIE